MHAHTHTRIFHAFFPLPSITDSRFSMWPCSFSLLSLPCPSPVSVSGHGLLSCIWDLKFACGVLCVCDGRRVNVSPPRPCIITSHCGFCLSLVVKFGSILYITTIWSLSLDILILCVSLCACVCVCV